MSRGEWEPGWGGDAERPERLPRTEDLPVAEQGYERAAVERAFDAFYRHAAQLDATLRALEAIDAFQRQAAELRAEMRALRTAGWGPIPTRPIWTAEARPGRGRGGVPDAVPRLAVEAAFIIVVAVGAALADVNTALIVLLVVAAWLVVGLGEIVVAAARPGSRSVPPPVAAPEPIPYELEPAPAAGPGEETEEAALLVPVEAPPPPEPADEAEEEPEPEGEPEEQPAQAAPSEPKPPRRFRRRKAERDVEPEPEPLPRHVRVLPSDSGDPWERGPELPIPDEGAAVEAAVEPRAATEPEEPAADAESEPAEEKAAEEDRPEPAPVHLVEPRQPAEPARAQLRRGRR